MISDDDLHDYLKRIDLTRSTSSDVNFLNELHFHHLTHIPFETFDLIDLKDLNIEKNSVFDRIVRQHRGGVCYQMNGLFASILKKLNFHVRLIPCSVFRAQTKTYSELFSHVSLFVTVSSGENYLCDVGFSLDTLTPLHFELDRIQFSNNAFFRLNKTVDGLFYQLERGFLKNEDSLMDLSAQRPFSTRFIDIDSQRIDWLVSYRFPTDFLERNVQIEDFQSCCSYILNSPDVILNHCSICRIQTIEPEVGAFGIVGKQFYQWKFRHGVEHRQNRPIENGEDLKEILQKYFDLKLNRDVELVENRSFLSN